MAFLLIKLQLQLILLVGFWCLKINCMHLLSNGANKIDAGVNTPLQSYNYSLTSTQEETTRIDPLGFKSHYNILPQFKKKSGDENLQDLKATRPKTRVKRRNIRSAHQEISYPTRQGRQDIGLGYLPQNLLLVKQQEEAMAVAMLQQQMISLQRSQQKYNEMIKSLRPYRNRNQDNYDDDDSESDEDDEFDSEEFMSYPTRMGFMPPIPGFGRRK